MKHIKHFLKLLLKEEGFNLFTLVSSNCLLVLILLRFIK